MIRRPTTALLALLLLLAACGAPPPPPEPEPFAPSGVYVGDPTLLPMAVAVVAFSADALPGAALADVGASATELTEGAWVVGSGFVGEDGEVELSFLDADAMPADALVPAADAFIGGFGADVPVGCTVSADDPAAGVTAFGVGAPFLLPVLIGFTPSGTTPLVATTTTVDITDPTLASVTLVGWVFADAPVTFSSTGTCADVDQDLTVAVALDAGWNRIVVRLSDLDTATATVVLEDDDGSALRLQTLF